jgi:hypothetical protein
VQHLRALEQSGNFDLAADKEKLFFIHTLMMDLGRKLKVLIQRKNVEPKGLLGLSMSSAFSNFAV